jgi:hypothetical protein
MDYSGLLRRSWEIVWNNKWLIILGLIVAIGTPSFNGRGNNSGFRVGPDDNGNFNDNFDFDSGDFQNIPRADLERALAVGLPLTIAFLCIGGTIAIALFVAGRVAAGGLIAGADQVETGAVSSFSQAWAGGWERVWTLIGIGLLPMLPWLVFWIIGLALLYPIMTLAGNTDDTAALMGLSGIVFTLGTISCIAFLVSTPLSILSGLADRAAMLENTGVFASFSRAWEIASANMGEALVLAVITIVARIVIALFSVPLFILGFIPPLCCVIWPGLFVLKGAIEAYFSTLWTLAWRQWTGRSITPRTGPAADIASAV